MQPSRFHPLCQFKVAGESVRTHTSESRNITYDHSQPMRRLLALLLITLTASAQSHIILSGKRVDREVTANELRVLFVGNSLTYFNEMPI